MQNEVTYNPLEAPVTRLLTAIESFDANGQRSAAGARQVRLAMTHLLGVCETEGPSGSAEIIPLIRPVVYATGWSTQLLGDIHRDLQLIVG